MAKLGYTWYPKDWGNSESVFELNLSERGLYREFIDLAMMNNNNTEIKKDVWTRKFCVTIDELNVILDKLISLKLIILGKNHLFIPSCESRLNLVRGGSSGGKNKPTPKPTPKPFVSLDEKNDKPTPKQIETKIETKIEIKLNLIDQYFKDFENGSEIVRMAQNQKTTVEVLKAYIPQFRLKANSEYPNYGKFVDHFRNTWLINKDKQPPQTGSSFKLGRK